MSISISDTFSSDEINGRRSSCLHYYYSSSRGGFYGTEKVLDRGKVHLTLSLALALTLGPEGVVHDEVGDVLDHGVLPRLREVQVQAVLLLLLLQLLLLLMVLLKILLLMLL